MGIRSELPPQQDACRPAAAPKVRRHRERLRHGPAQRPSREFVRACRRQGRLPVPPPAERGDASPPIARRASSRVRCRLPAPCPDTCPVCCTQTGARSCAQRKRRRFLPPVDPSSPERHQAGSRARAAQPAQDTKGSSRRGASSRGAESQSSPRAQLSHCCAYRCGEKRTDNTHRDRRRAGPQRQ